MSVSGKRVFLLATSGLLLIAMAIYLLPSRPAYAAQITSRSLTLEPGTVGGSTPGDGNPAHTVNHLFSFTLPTAGNISSIKFQYCTTADIDIGGTCTTPTGLVTTAATLGTQSGVSFTSLVNTTNGSPYLTATAPINIVTSGSPNNVVSFDLLGIQNPDNTNCAGGAPASNNCTFYVRISTYASTDTTGLPVDTGTVAASTATQIQLIGTMPESLIFCTGKTVSTNVNGTPDCSTATAGSVTFPMLFSPTATAFVTSQMAASTNALSGYTITVTGPTLTNGSYTIPAMTSADLSQIGKGQFGLNLAANTGATTGDPNITGLAGGYVDSAYVNPAPNGTNFMGKAATNFNIGDPDALGGAQASQFMFVPSTPTTVAASDNGTGSGAPTDSQIFTTSYIVNVSGSQPAGTYTTTLTYICTPEF